MNGVHDMGGMHGFGVIKREDNEPVFHHAWERRVFALRMACGGLRKWNIDMARHANERMPPAEYLAAAYYERWLSGLELLLIEHGLVTQVEIETGNSIAPALHNLTAFPPDRVENAVRGGSRYRVDADVPARFLVGALVTTRNINPVGATRLPRYARDKQGEIERDHGVFIFPDSNAAGLGPKPQHLYSVRFAAKELWGDQAPSNDGIYLDLWDDYLDPI